MITAWNDFHGIMSCVVYGAFFPVDVPLQDNGNLQSHVVHLIRLNL